MSFLVQEKDYHIYTLVVDLMYLHKSDSILSQIGTQILLSRGERGFIISEKNSRLVWHLLSVYLLGYQVQTIPQLRYILEPDAPTCAQAQFGGCAWAQFDRWALNWGSLTDEHSHIFNYRAQWNGKSHDLSERFMQINTYLDIISLITLNITFHPYSKQSLHYVALIKLTSSTWCYSQVAIMLTLQC